MYSDMMRTQMLERVYENLTRIHSQIQHILYGKSPRTNCQSCGRTWKTLPEFSGKNGETAQHKSELVKNETGQMKRKFSRS